MNELKPEDVMRALELHADHLTENCHECPYGDKLGDFEKQCVIYLVEDAIDLLREKDKAIYFFQSAANLHEAEYNELVAKTEYQDAVIERLQGALKAEERHNELTMECAKKALANARVEAVSEFAEGLCEGRVSNDPVVIAVRCAEKEMKGENE